MQEDLSCFGVVWQPKAHRGGSGEGKKDSPKYEHVLEANASQSVKRRRKGWILQTDDGPKAPMK